MHGSTRLKWNPKIVSSMGAHNPQTPHLRTALEMRPQANEQAIMMEASWDMS